MEFKVNIAAILVAVVVNFILLFVWYTTLFMKMWAKEMGYDPNMRPHGKTMAKGMAFTVIGNFLFTRCLRGPSQAGNLFLVQKK